jgi:signal transduction histidine kinase
VRDRSRPWTASDLEAADDLQRRALEVDLERRLWSEQRAVRARDELIAVVSHDLKNSLSAILMQADLMLQRARGEDLSRAGAEGIRRSATRTMAMIDDLMDLAKIEAQRFVVGLQFVDSRAMVEEALLAASPLAQTKRIALSVELIDAPKVEADPGQIQRVLANLLGNAIKFSPEGGTVTVRAERSGVDLMITVADTGPGIPADHLPWVFERYWQARPASHVGAGLGLYIAKGVVTAHGGRIWAESSASGARLTFTLPLVKADPQNSERKFASSMTIKHVLD